MSAAPDIDYQRKTEVLLEALPYLQRFRGAIFVAKFGGSFVDSREARLAVALDLTFLAVAGIRVVVVHGGGKAINRAMEEAQLKPEFRNGLRVTDAATANIVERTLNGVINREIVEALREKGGEARPVRGQDVLTVRKLETDDSGQPLDLGFVGEVTEVDTTGLHSLLEMGRIPVISPVGRGRDGHLYNVNADTAAASVAAALGARRLIYLSDVPGLLADPKDPKSLISTLSVDRVEHLKATGVIGSGMRPKVDSAVAALRGGVRRVHFIDGRVPHSMLLEIFTDRGVGTEIVAAGVGEAAS